MSRRYLIGLLPGLVAATLHAQVSDSDSLDAFLRRQAGRGFAGVVTVATADSVLWQGAYGPPHTTRGAGRAFWIASITKSFTAAAILLLAHQGSLSLDDSLPAFFPETPPDKRPITIRQLLTHSAGFGSTYTGGGLSTREAAVRAILSQPLARRPGTGYQYENDGYELLAAIIEVRSGTEWADFLRQRLLLPLGLRQTGFWCSPHPGRAPPVALGDSTTSCTMADLHTPRDDWGHRGANGMSSTAADLLRWARLLSHPPMQWSAILEPIGRPALWVRREGAYDVWSGLGSRVYTKGGRVTELWLSGSGDDGHTSVVRALDTGRIIIVLSNSGRRGDATWSSFIALQVLPRD